MILAAAVILAACDSSEPTPPPTPDPGPVPPNAERISGNERLGWSQQASSGEELSTFRYLIYLDGAGADAQDVTCSATAGPAGFACTARMPPMSGGLHALTLSSYIDSGGSRLESPRSPAVSVFLVTQTTAGAGSPAGDPAGTSGPMTTRDGVRLFSEVVVDGLDDPTDLAFAADGRILVAERGGRIRVVHGRRLVAAPAIALPDVDVSKGGGLLSVATDPQDTHRFVFALYTTARGFRLARFQLVADTLGNRAILLDEIPASVGDPSGFVRIGPDARLYVGLDDSGNARRSGDLGSFSGKILRLNVDGGTPADQSTGSPIYSADMTAPRGAAWTSSGTLWVVDSADGSTALARPIRRPGAGNPRYRLPEGTDPSAVAVYPEKPGALRGNIFVGARGTGAILRLVPDASDPAKIASTELLYDESFGRPAAVAISSDGAIYVCTSHSLVRLMAR
jgi:glucose/arabinose dehydrogenase